MDDDEALTLLDNAYKERAKRLSNTYEPQQRRTVVGLAYDAAKRKADIARRSAAANISSTAAATTDAVTTVASKQVSDFNFYFILSL